MEVHSSEETTHIFVWAVSLPGRYTQSIEALGTFHINGIFELVLTGQVVGLDVSNISHLPIPRGMQLLFPKPYPYLSRCLSPISKVHSMHSIPKVSSHLIFLGMLEEQTCHLSPPTKPSSPISSLLTSSTRYSNSPSDIHQFYFKMFRRKWSGLPADPAFPLDLQGLGYA